MERKYKNTDIQIKYFRKETKSEISLDDQKLKFFDYSYITNVKLFEKISNQSINCLIRNIDLIKKSLSKDECKSFCQKIIKLIYLRKDLCECKKFNIPLFFTPFGECLTGDGRILISTFYVPDIKFDCVFYKKEFKNGFGTIEKLVREISEKRKLSLEENTVLCSMENIKLNNNVVEYIRSLEFVDHYVYDQRLFDCSQGQYLSWNNLDYNLWSEVYDIIKKKNLSNIDDYVDLLHTITSIEI
jgi:hypothetical protein